MNSIIPVKIRAHHLLCMQGYQGYGYSQDFNENLQQVIHCIKTNPNFIIEVITDSDIICSCCPNLVESRCKKDENSEFRIFTMDSEVLRLTDLKVGVIDKASYFIDIINSKFKTKAQLYSVCGDCQWKEICLWYSSIE